MNKILEENKINYQKIVDPYTKVAIVGQVDHGKTFLFEKLTGEKKIDQEPGRITQTVYLSIQENIVFFDTPGHESFSHMKQHVFNVTNLVLLVISAKKVAQSEKILKELNNLNQKIIVLISFTENITENELFDELSRINVLPTQMGGNYEIFLLRYDEFKYPASTYVPSMTIPELLSYINDFSLLVEKYTYEGHFGMFYLLNSYYEEKKGNYYSALTIGGELIQQYDYVVNNGKQMHILSEDMNFSHSLKKIIGFPKQFFFKSDQNFLIGNIYFTYPEKKNKDENTVKEVLETKDKLVFFLISQEEEKIEAIKKNFSKDDITFVSKVGAPSLLDLKYIKEKNSIIIFYNFSVNKNIIQVLKAQNILFFSSPDFYQIQDFIARSYDNFLIKKELNDIKKDYFGLAKVIKVFHVPQKNIVGCKLLEGEVKKEYKAFIIRKDEIKGKLIFINNLEIIGKKVPIVVKGSQFGIDLEVDLEILLGDTIIFK